MPSEPDHLRAEIARLRARMAADQREIYLLEALIEERERLRGVPGSANMGRMEAVSDRRALKISKSMSGRASAEVLALHAAGLTPKEAAEICGTTRDMLKQAWARGKQFRPMRPDWAKKLAARGVPTSTWHKE